MTVLSVPLRRLVVAVLVGGSAFAPPAVAQEQAPPAAPVTTANAARDGLDPYLRTLSWRCIGPARGGRAQAAAGVPGDPRTYYMGATGGGVWKTTDAGVSWRPITDGQVGTGSVGAVAVAPSDPNVVYVGMGEVDVRGNFSHGDGMYRSLDAGKTWTRIGLEDARQVGRIRVHPSDPDLVYVAALGHVFGPNHQRGVFRSRDGGSTWEHLLFVDEDTGAVDLAMDPSNPRILYAAFWQVRRTPWSLESGGPGSGLYKSSDGGETWDELTSGLPEGIKGKIGVAVSPVDGDRVWALVEAENGGLFRSEDAGATWRRVNRDRDLRQRAWYYTRIYADTQDRDTVYVMNVRFHKSVDGGRTFTTIRVPHGDNHDLWIAPDDNLRMVNANDGGANVSFDGGETWSRQDNQATAQFYHVAVDDQFPYRVYGAQQDNSTVSISSRNRPGWGREDYHSVGGGESGYVVPVPGNPDIVYAGSYGGYLTRYDHDTGKRRNITVWPENPMGWGAEALDYRFQWTFPIVISPHDPDRIYVGGNVLFESENGGQSWTAISPDLTTDDESKQGPSGGPITKDNTGVEYYCTIFTIAESPLREGMIWAGTDDGLVHLTMDGGATWEEVTPPDMGAWPLISLVEASPHDPDKAYLAVNRYKMDDLAPYVYRTTDRGATWELIVDGIASDAFVRAVREDPRRQGLLYAGTETGVWVSFDDGAAWRPLQLDLPVTPVTDLAVTEEDLVVSTQGRSFWVLEDLAPVRQLTDEVQTAEAFLLAPGPTYRQRWDAVRVHHGFRSPAPSAADETVPASRALEIVDADGFVVRTWSGDELSADAGMNVVAWDMRYPGATEVPGSVLWAGSTRGPMAPPGNYRARLRVGEATLERTFEIRGDPRVGTTRAEYQAQFELLLDIRAALDAAHVAVNGIRELRGQIEATVARARAAEAEEAAEAIGSAAEAIESELRAIEEALIQTRNEAPQDPLNYPVKLNNKLATLANVVEGDFPVTEQARAVFEQLRGELDGWLRRLDGIRAERIPSFNAMVREHEIPAVTP